MVPKAREVSGIDPDTTLRNVGHSLRAARVRSILLVHGTFTGTDGLGLINQFQKMVPSASHLADSVKAAVDQVLKDCGNFTEAYAHRFENAINVVHEPRIDVRRVVWPGQNSHVGRAEGAIRLIDHIRNIRPPCSAEDRVLVWGHSHGGNVAALATNLLGGTLEARQRFFHATRDYAVTLGDASDRDTWRRNEHDLMRQSDLNLPGLDVATFGTPIRYGWEADGYGQLVHFVHHRATDPRGQFLAAFPASVEELFKNPAGDYVQQLGVAGTNLFAGLLSRGVRRTEWRLKKLLQSDVRNRDIVRHAMMGKRVAGRWNNAAD